MPKKRNRRADFDSPWKDALEYFLPSFLALLFPHIYASIDWSKPYEALDKELHKLARGARSKNSLADKRFKVWRLNGEEAWLLIHIEVQGDPEDDFPLRMFRCNTRAFDLYNRTVVSLAVLTDERTSWRPERFDYGDWGGSTGIKFLTTKLIDWRGRELELEANSNPFASVVLAHLRAIQTRKDPNSRKKYKIGLIKGLFQFGWLPEDVRQLFRVIDWMMDLPWELQQGFQNELHAWEEEKSMPYITSVERFGIELGHRQGLSEGLQKGIAIALAAKFEKVDKRLIAKVRGITKVDELEALLEAIPGCQKIQDFRDRLAAT